LVTLTLLVIEIPLKHNEAINEPTKDQMFFYQPFMHSLMKIIFKKIGKKNCILAFRVQSAHSLF
jgi:hypothetical protein